MSEGSDFDIFFVPSRKLMTRVAGPVITGSGCGKKMPSAYPFSIDAVAEVVVEFLGDVARQLEVLLLVLADRHVRGAIGENVGRHQVRINVETHRGVLAVLAGLLLELRHAVEPAEARDAIEHPRQLGVLGHLALIEQDALLGIEAGGDVSGRHLADGLLQLGGILPNGDRVHVDDAVDALVRLLQLDPVEHGTEVIPQMQAAGRLHAGKHAFLECHGSPLRDWRGFMARRAAPRKTGMVQSGPGGGVRRVRKARAWRRSSAPVANTAIV